VKGQQSEDHTVPTRCPTFTTIWPYSVITLQLISRSTVSLQKLTVVQRSFQSRLIPNITDTSATRCACVVLRLFFKAKLQLISCYKVLVY
jgi:hypothetical protein